MSLVAYHRKGNIYRADRLGGGFVYVRAADIGKARKFVSDKLKEYVTVRELNEYEKQLVAFHDIIESDAS